MLVKMQNANMPNSDLGVRGRVYRSDAEGVFKMEADHADLLTGTPGWLDPRKRKRTPRKAAESLKGKVARLKAELDEAGSKATAATKLAYAAQDAYDEALDEFEALSEEADDLEAKEAKAAEEAADKAEEAADGEEDVPALAEPPAPAEEPAEGDLAPYDQWPYADLVAETKARMDADPEFDPPKSKKAADIVTALEADDERTTSE